MCVFPCNEVLYKTCQNNISAKTFPRKRVLREWELGTFTKLKKVLQSSDPMMVMYKAFECYYLGCIADPGVCVPTCRVEKTQLELTQGCRDCYGNFVACWVGNTSAQCAVPGQGAAGCFLFGWSDKCDSCLTANQKCKTEYEACSSLNLDPVIEKFKNASN